MMKDKVNASMFTVLFYMVSAGSGYLATVAGPNYIGVWMAAFSVIIGTAATIMLFMILFGEYE